MNNQLATVCGKVNVGDQVTRNSGETATVIKVMRKLDTRNVIGWYGGVIGKQERFEVLLSN